MNNVFVYIEIEEREIADVSLELLTKGRELANTLGVKLEAEVIGHNVKDLAPGDYQVIVECAGETSVRHLVIKR